MRRDHSGIPETLKQVHFNARGLVPVVAQDHKTKQVLMLAWMNREALRQTLDTGRMVYWSRSRRQLWRKGDTSGHTQQLVALTLDCDGDALLAWVKQVGPACHTGARSCFFNEVPSSVRSSGSSTRKRRTRSKKTRS